MSLKGEDIWKILYVLLLMSIIAISSQAMTVGSGVKFMGPSTQYMVGEETTFTGGLTLIGNQLSFDSHSYELTGSAGTLEVVLNTWATNALNMTETPSSAQTVFHNISGMNVSTNMSVDLNDTEIGSTVTNAAGLVEYISPSISGYSNFYFDASGASCSATSGSVSIVKGISGMEYVAEVTTSTENITLTCNGLNASTGGDCNFAPRWDVSGIRPYQMVSNVTWLQFPYNSTDAIDSCDITMFTSKTGSFEIPLQFDPILADANLSIVNPNKTSAIRTNYIQT